jgi:predicted DNA-binding protein
MANSRNKSNSIHVMLDGELHKELQAQSKKTGKPMSELAREFIHRGLSNQAANDSLDIVDETIRRTLKQVFKPNIERLAALSSKAAISSGQSAYLLAQVIGDMGKSDVKEVWESSRKKAINQIKRHENFNEEGEIE